MCFKLKRTAQSGYTLIELAITLVIIGVLLTPAIAMYHQYKVKSDYDETGVSISEALKAVGDFREAYGRYPCPAPEDVASDSALYGLENCALAVRDLSARAGMGDIVFGSLPFKSMSLQENEIYDSYGSRLKYAVTENLTSSTTFSVGNGGITILDKNGDQMLTPIDSGHFIVVSHGQNGIGGFTRTGIMRSVCVGSGNASEEENCDNDNTFHVGELDSQFDDRAGYFSSEEISEWQLEDVNSTNIFLKDARDMAIGVFTSDDVTASEQSAIRSATAGSGGITANNFTFMTNNLCEFGESATSADCFMHTLLTEEHLPGTGLVCADTEPFLIGISGTQTPICEESITIGCPAGMFMAGLNADRSPVCRGIPPASCVAEDIVTTCGETRTLAARNHSEYELAYSGQCYRFPASHDTAFFASGIVAKTTPQLNTWISDLNSVDRDQSSCGTTASTAQVRDAYVCNAGTWNHASAHERLTAASHSFSSNYALNATSQNVEQNFPYTKTFDLLNSTSQHDCWCREDYRLTTPACPSGLSGTGIRIQKYRCPQTNSSSKAYTTVFEDFGACACVPGPRNTNQSCLAYYNANNSPTFSSGLTGNVVLTHDNICNGAGALEQVLPPTNVNVSACACPSYAPTITRTACPTGMTNNFTWSLNSTSYTETGVAAITTSEFICPSTTGFGGVPTPGSQTPAVNVAGIPACTCDNTYTEDRLEACPANQEGAGITRRFQRNCVTGLMEDTGLIVSNHCNDCAWNAGNGGEDSDSKLGGSSKEVGRQCSCGSTPAPVCWADGGSTAAYKTYTNCQCVIDLH